MTGVRRGHCLLVLIILASAGTVTLAGGAAPATVWDGVYSVEQAQRGEAIYSAECELCHAANMRGGPAARGLIGLGFQILWKDKSVAELYETTRGKMPPGNPGSLYEQDYLDVLAAVLQRNGFPAGSAELTPDTGLLQSIRLTWEQP